MYLSRVEIDFANRQKIRDLKHLGAYHHWVETLFPQEISEGIRTRKLWRIDKIQGKQYLLVVSQSKPDVEAFEKYGKQGTTAIKEYDPYIQSLNQGQRLRFRITLNPVISIAIEKGSGKRGKVVAHVTVSHQMKFLRDRAEKNGFELQEDEFFVVENKQEKLMKKNNKTVMISKVTFEGNLTIKDIKTFQKTLVEGIGREKAYGCGMLTVIPV